MRYKTVYYHQFWYSRYAGITPTALDGDFKKNEVRKHLLYLRVLALFFDRIYIPRTHVLTQFSPLQWEIADEVFKTPEVAYLNELGTLRISTLPSLDAQNDTQRILERAAFTTDVTYAQTQPFLVRIPKTQLYTIDSVRESKTDTIEFAEYARWLSIAAPKLSQKILDIVERSTLTGVPFFHEKFLRRIRNTLNQSEFEKVWRETNSIYLTNGAPNQYGVIAPFDPSIESQSYRYKPDQIDRYLYHPKSLDRFLRLLLPPNEIYKLNHAPIHMTLATMVTDQTTAESFREAYSKIVQRISEIAYDIHQANVDTTDAVEHWFNRALDGQLYQKTSTAQKITDAAKDFGEDLNAVGGMYGALIKPTIEYGSRGILQLMRKRRHPEIFEFIVKLRSHLRSL